MKKTIIKGTPRKQVDQYIRDAEKRLKNGKVPYITVKSKEKNLISFKNRLNVTSFTLESVQTELDLIATENGTTFDNLFVMAETNQLPVEVNDMVMSLFSIAKTLRN